MYAILDTETTGLYNFELPAGDALQPRLAEIALIVVDDDHQMVNCMSFIIRPDASYPAEYDEKAIGLHGIDRALGEKVGVPFGLVAGFLFANIERCDRLVCHGMKHDLEILQNEFVRMQQPCPYPQMIEKKEKLCTMRYFSQNYRLKGAWAGKWPSLAEMHLHLLKESFSGAHRAFPDCTATWRCYTKMMEDKQAEHDLA